MTPSEPAGPRSAARAVLDRCACFSDLPSDVVDEIARRMHERRWSAGEPIIRQGEEAGWMVVVGDGAARVDVHAPSGDVHTVAHVGPSDLVGEMALLTRQLRVADVVAESDVTGWVLPAADFDDVAAMFPELGTVLTHLVADRLGGGDVDGLSGKSLDRYVIVRCIGRGGMAVVYEAADAETGERVALKMMSHRLVYERGALARFQREADLLLAVDHPNVVRVRRRFHAFRTHFIVMELCRGASLARRIADGGPLGAAAVRRLAGELVSGLAAMHAHGVLHRDVKPANVVFGDGGTAKLADFGLAKSAEPDAAPTIAVTEARTVLGTPAYMAPEVLAGDAATRESDLYSLGCVLLEAATGRCPFPEDTWSGILRAKRNFEAPPAAALGIDEDVASFLFHALAPSPELRVCDLRRVASWR